MVVIKKQNMKDQIKQDILEFLDIRDENNFSDIELFKLLDKKRKATHPDRTTDDDVKKEYEEKIKTANELYEKFGKFIKDESSNNTYLQIYDNEISLDYVMVKFENDELKEENKKLISEIENLKKELKQQKKLIKSLNSKKIAEETEKLKDVYKPQKNNLLILGISAIVGILLQLLSQTEKAIAIYMKYLPGLNPNLLNYITLGLLSIITFIFLTSYIKRYIIHHWSEKVKSTEFISELFDYVLENVEANENWKYKYITKVYNFKERVIYNFIKNSFEPKTFYEKAFMRIIGLNIYSVFENFKKIIIYELVNKEIIKIDGNIGFDKVFKYQDNIR